MFVYLIIATMAIVVGRSPAPAGLNHSAPAPALWQTCLEPPPYLREGITTARARRIPREHCTPALLCLLCCSQCAQQVCVQKYDLGRDLNYEPAHGCSCVCTPVDGCSSAGRPHYYPAVPSGVLLETRTRQQMLLCPRERMIVSQLMCE